MLEFIMDLIFDIILEGAVVVVSEKKVPMPIRVIAFCIVAILYLGISGLFFFASVSSWMNNEKAVSIIFFALGLFVLIGGIYQIRKEIKKRKDHDEKGELYEKI